MESRNAYPDLIFIISLSLIILFTFTGVHQLLYLDVFQTRLTGMPYIASLARPISWGLPFTELVVVVLLAFKKYRPMGLYASLVLLALFTAYIIIVLQFSDSIPCSCSGIIPQLGWRDHILFNGTVMLLALLAIIRSKKAQRIPNDTT